MKTRWLAYGAAVLIAQLTLADGILIHGFTYHGKRHYEEQQGERVVERRYNSVNPGFAYRFDNGLTLGTYRNSYYRWSVYGAYTYMFTDNFGAFAGYASNYNNHGGGNIRAGLLARSNDLGNGWRLGLLGQPIQTKRIDAVISAYLSKDW
ncbi:hypothetical protein [Chitinimonas naiadis]